MLVLALRLGLAPFFVAAVTLLERWFGRAAGGVLAGLPLTSAPLLLVLALRDGPGFAAAGAETAVWGAGVQSAIYWTYARTAGAAPRGRGGVATCLIVIAAVFATGVAGLAFLLAGWHPPVLVGLAAVAVVAGAVLWRWPRGARPSSGAVVHHGPRTLAVRCAVAEALTLAVAEIAPVTGPALAGLLGTLPVLALTVAVSAHREAGPAAARQTLRAVARATPAVGVFLAVLALGLPRWPVALAFGAAVVGAVVVTAVLRGALQRTRSE